MNNDDRLGVRDDDVAKLFAAARAYRPSARARRRTLRALGLPVGLSLAGSSLAHAAHLLAFSLKGWGMVAGIVGAVGTAAGVASVAYVATTPSRPQLAPSPHRPSSRTGASPAMVRAPRWAAMARGDADARVPPSGPVETPVAGASPPAAAFAQVPTGVHAATSTHASTSVRKKTTQAPPSDERSLAEAAPSAATAPLAPLSLTPLPERAPIEPAPLERGPATVGGAAVFLPAPSTSPPSTLRGELSLVAEAQARLRVGDAPRAFAALDRHARLYPGGLLEEEIELLRLRAFVVEGDAPGAHLAGESFLRRHPGSPLAARARSLMNGLGGPRRDEVRPQVGPHDPFDHGESR